MAEFIAPLARCERCGLVSHAVLLRPAMTAYADPNENQPMYLCEPCHEDYVGYWTCMWEEYHQMTRG